MKPQLTLLAVGLACAWNVAQATEFGSVVSTTPVVAQVAVPMQQCADQQETYRPQTSGGGAVLGAVVGGVLGHQIGGGAGRALATGAGVVAGAAVGNQVEANNTAPVTTTVRNCRDATAYQNRVVGYDVVYDYEGRRYSTRLDHDPGLRIALEVNVAPAGGAVATNDDQAPPVVYGPPATYGPPVVYAPGPYYGNDPYYSGYPVYPASSVVVGASFGGGYRHGRYH
jgi:uncharacterized protein YcfJ